MAEAITQQSLCFEHQRRHLLQHITTYNDDIVTDYVIVISHILS